MPYNDYELGFSTKTNTQTSKRANQKKTVKDIDGNNQVKSNMYILTEVKLNKLLLLSKEDYPHRRVPIYLISCWWYISI